MMDSADFIAPGVDGVLWVSVIIFFCLQELGAILNRSRFYGQKQHLSWVRHRIVAVLL